MSWSYGLHIKVRGLNRCNWIVRNLLKNSLCARVIYCSSPRQSTVEMCGIAILVSEILHWEDDWDECLVNTRRNSRDERVTSSECPALLSYSSFHRINPPAEKLEYSYLAVIARQVIMFAIYFTKAILGKEFKWHCPPDDRMAIRSHSCSITPCL